MKVFMKPKIAALIIVVLSLLGILLFDLSCR